MQKHTDQLREGIMEQTPRHLYRYRSTNIIYLREILIDNVLYFASPVSFNDPFDSYPDFDFTGTEIEWEKKLKKLAKSRGIKLKSHEAKMEARKIKRNGVDQLSKNVDIDYLRNQIGVLCLTSDNKNILMWSHYAEGHKGVCLEFSVKTNEPIIGVSFKVQYRKHYPMHKYVKVDTKDVIFDMMLTKPTDWEYEKEWRVISQKNVHLEGPGKYSFDPSLLTKIIFGCRATQSFIEEIKKIINARKSPVELWKATPILKDYKIEIHPLSS